MSALKTLVEIRTVKETWKFNSYHSQLEKLIVVKREALILFEINGFAIKEIAKIQKLSEGAEKVNLNPARKEPQVRTIDTLNSIKKQKY